jgi:hypothetical protein
VSGSILPEDCEGKSPNISWMESVESPKRQLSFVCIGTGLIG